MEKPVAMPMGGMRILRAVTAVRPSRTRQTRTPQSPMTETMAVKAVLDSIRQAFRIEATSRGVGRLFLNPGFRILSKAPQRVHAVDAGQRLAGLVEMRGDDQAAAGLQL